MEENLCNSGVGVLDKVVAILNCLETGPASLAQLVEQTHFARPTVHRLALALEYHRIITRDNAGRFVLGPRLSELSAAVGEDRLLALALPVLKALCDHTHESTQLYTRQGDQRVCVAAVERQVGLRNSVPIGAVLPMKVGSAAQVLLAWEDPDKIIRSLRNATFNAMTLSNVRKCGWAQSVGEREQGVASVSAPIRGSSGKVIAAISVSGPIERMGHQPGRLHGLAVIAAANKLTELLQRSSH
ncbi:IclR family transcriptional regulator [Actinomyces sp. zg-332]|uniref:IclR family transcriptional regulator n=1 Tax=Actinomyces sp. zg-332 TaxID=2708340 RepID=UPI0014214554|nr:IclR family transcriptional regulator [Actinomyces sp. zg-332]QPK93889.1 IclR family transcriptional regulator [Actinomyces sp. zg-332]